MEIASGVHRIDTEFGGRQNSLYLLRGRDRTALIDSAVSETVRESVLPTLAKMGVERLDYVINTHADLDHCGGNGLLLEAYPAATLICQELDRAWIQDFVVLIDERYDECATLGMPETQEFKDFLLEITDSAAVDQTFDKSLLLDLGDDWQVELRHTPGHSPGHLAVWEPRSKMAIIGDAVLYDGLYYSDGRPAFPPTFRYVDDYRSSIAALDSWGAQVLSTSHYPMREGSEVQAFFERSAAFVDSCEAVMIELFDHKDEWSLQELIEAAAPRLGEWDAESRGALKYPLLGHLEQMEHHAAITRGVTDVPRWSRA